jgi:hypothetical protein
MDRKSRQEARGKRQQAIGKGDDRRITDDGPTTDDR